MNRKELSIVPEDKVWLENRISELEKNIQDLGPDFYDVFNQSSETWHDNAPFDALRDKQSVLFAELTKLKDIRTNAALSLPKAKKCLVNIGSTFIMNSKSYFLAGDWTPHAGTTQNESIIISAQSPLGSEVLGKRVAESTRFGTIQSIIN